MWLNWEHDTGTPLVSAYQLRPIIILRSQYMLLLQAVTCGTQSVRLAFAT
jgi:hypothetical protein